MCCQENVLHKDRFASAGPLSSILHQALHPQEADTYQWIEFHRLLCFQTSLHLQQIESLGGSWVGNEIRVLIPWLPPREGAWDSPLTEVSALREVTLSTDLSPGSSNLSRPPPFGPSSGTSAVLASTFCTAAKSSPAAHPCTLPK